MAIVLPVTFPSATHGEMAGARAGMQLASTARPAGPAWAVGLHESGTPDPYCNVPFGDIPARRETKRRTFAQVTLHSIKTMHARCTYCMS